MRTTLTLQDDVAVFLERVRKQRGMSLKDLVNEALRLGLAELERDAATTAIRFRTRSVSAGRCLLPSLDDVPTALEVGEGDGHK